jgi:hypothetical protein
MIVGLFFLVFGAFLLIAGLRRRERDLIVARLWLETNGTVVSNKPLGFRASVPVVQFTTADGQLVQFTSKVGASRLGRPLDEPYFAEGEIVPIIYDPRDPQSARIRTGFIFWGPCIALMSGALICLFIGTVRLVQHLLG